MPTSSHIDQVSSGIDLQKTSEIAPHTVVLKQGSDTGEQACCAVNNSAENIRKIYMTYYTVF